jgi:uncharacterized membrane protein
MKNIIQSKALYNSIIIASSVGLLASFFQTLEKIALIENPHAILTCNINSIFSCTNILNTWQSSIFGFPNSLMCIAFFMLTLTVGLVGRTGGIVGVNMRLVAQGFTMFFVLFGFWYLWQSIFAVGSVCIFCMFCYASVLTISGVLFRLNSNDLPVSKKVQHFIDKQIANKNDILVWLLIGFIIIAEIFIKFA